MNISRRGLLTGVSGGLIGLSGCISAPRVKDSPGEPQTHSQTPSDTQTSSTESPNWRLSDLSAEASVVEQATSTHPLMVELSISSNHEFPVTLVPSDKARMLEYIPPLEGSMVDLVMIPEMKEYDVEPESRTNGCWRLDAESPDVALARIGFVALRLPYTLGPGETYNIQHEVYHNIASETCFPDTTYSTIKVLQFSKDPAIEPGEQPVEGPKFRLTFTLTVNETANAGLTIDRPA